LRRALRAAEKQRVFLQMLVKSMRSFARSSEWLEKDSGGTIVEFAVASILLMTVIFAIMDFSRCIYFDHYVRYTAEEASRYAMVRGATWNNSVCLNPSTQSCTASSGDVTRFANSITPFQGSGNLAVTTTWTGKTPTGSLCSSSGVNNSPGCVVSVKVAYNFNFVLPFLPKNALILSSSSSVVIST
jgi:Flp pilus assembly protein TadG